MSKCKQCGKDHSIRVAEELVVVHPDFETPMCMGDPACFREVWRDGLCVHHTPRSA